MLIGKDPAMITDYPYQLLMRRIHFVVTAQTAVVLCHMTERNRNAVPGLCSHFLPVDKTIPNAV